MIECGIIGCQCCGKIGRDLDVFAATIDLHADLGRAVVGPDGPDVEPRRSPEAAGQDLRIIAGHHRIGILIRLKLRRIEQERLGIGGELSRILDGVGADAQRAEAGAHCCDRHDILARRAVFGGHGEFDRASREVDLGAGGRGHRRAGADLHFHSQRRQIRVAGENVRPAVALAADGACAGDLEGEKLVFVVFQHLEAVEDGQAVIFARVILLPLDAVERDILIGVQGTHEAVQLHIGQGHGFGRGARVVVADGGEDANLLVVEIADGFAAVAHALQFANQLARVRLGLGVAVGNGAGMVAVVHALFRVIDRAGQAADGLRSGDGADVIAVLHQATQMTDDAARVFALSGDSAVVCAAGNEAIVIAAAFCCLGGDAADDARTRDFTVVRAADDARGGRDDAADFIAARAGGGSVLRVAGHVAVVCAVVNFGGERDEAAHIQTAALATARIDAAIVDTVFDPTAGIIGQHAAPAAESDGAGLVEDQVFDDRAGAQLAEEAEILGVRVIDKVFDAVVITVVDAVEVITGRGAARLDTDGRPCDAGHIDVRRLLDEHAVHPVAAVDPLGQRVQRVQTVDPDGVGLGAGALEGIYFLREREEDVERERVALSAVRGRERQDLVGQIAAVGLALDAGLGGDGGRALRRGEGRAVQRELGGRIHRALEGHAVFGKIQRAVERFAVDRERDLRAVGPGFVQSRIKADRGLPIPVLFQRDEAAGRALGHGDGDVRHIREREAGDLSDRARDAQLGDQRQPGDRAVADGDADRTDLLQPLRERQRFELLQAGNGHALDRFDAAAEDDLLELRIERVVTAEERLKAQGGHVVRDDDLLHLFFPVPPGAAGAAGELAGAGEGQRFRGFVIAPLDRAVDALGRLFHGLAADQDLRAAVPAGGEAVDRVLTVAGREDDLLVGGPLVKCGLADRGDRGRETNRAHIRDLFKRMAADRLHAFGDDDGLSGLALRERVIRHRLAARREYDGFQVLAVQEVRNTVKGSIFRKEVDVFDL